MTKYIVRQVTAVPCSSSRPGTREYKDNRGRIQVLECKLEMSISAQLAPGLDLLGDMPRESEFNTVPI